MGGCVACQVEAGAWELLCDALATPSKDAQTRDPGSQSLDTRHGARDTTHVTRHARREIPVLTRGEVGAGPAADGLARGHGHAAPSPR
eukprot:3283845-Rhodomonas_salina.1